MSNKKLQELGIFVRKKIEDLIYSITKEMPFYANLLSRFKKRENYEIPIAAVTIERAFPVLLYNPKGFMRSPFREQVFILLHEIAHITSLHHLRGKGKDPGLWNIAADLEINQRIETSFCDRPHWVLMPHHFDVPEHLSAEEYYNILESRDEPIELPQELANSLMDDIVNNNKNGQNNDSDGNGQNDQGNENPKAKGFERLHPHWEELAEKNPDLQKGIIQRMVRDSMSKSAGNIPGEMNYILEKLFEPQIQWPRYIRAFFSSIRSVTKRRTWSRPNRKHGRIKMGTIKNRTSQLLVAIDTSASLRDDDLSQFFAEIKELKKTTDVEITIVQCDTEIQAVQKWDEINIDEFEVRGRGGTSFLPVYELIENKIYKDFTLQEIPDGVIYLTDGWGPAPDESSVKTLWVLTEDGRVPYNENGSSEITWGEVVYLNE